MGCLGRSLRSCYLFHNMATECLEAVIRQFWLVAFEVTGVLQDPRRR